MVNVRLGQVDWHNSWSSSLAHGSDGRQAAGHVADMSLQFRTTMQDRVWLDPMGVQHARRLG
jgi:hypothetical protein